MATPKRKSKPKVVPFPPKGIASVRYEGGKTITTYAGGKNLATSKKVVSKGDPYSTPAGRKAMIAKGKKK